MNTKSALSGLAIAALTAPLVMSGAAFAEPREDKAHHRIELSDFDQNGDGEVTVDEFDAVWAEKAAEWREHRDARRARGEERREERRDERAGDAGTERPSPRYHDGTGYLPPNLHIPSGSEIDTDGDGVISAAEFDAARAAVRERWQERMQKGWSHDRPHADDDYGEDDEDDRGDQD